MHITFSPRRDDRPLTLERAGDTLILNGDTFDFSDLPDGASLPAGAVDDTWFVDAIHREGGTLRMTLILPHGAQAPHECRFPAPISMDRDGPIPLPLSVSMSTQETPA